MILAANPSCGCMKIPNSLLGKPVSPGAVVEVPVIMKTETRSGELSGLVRIVCGHKPANGAKITETSEIIVRLKCEIQNRIKITPEKIDFGNIVSREAATVSFTVMRTDGGKLTDIRTEILGERFRLEDFVISCEGGQEIAKGRIVPAEDVFSTGGHYGGALQLHCDDIGVKETMQIVDISAVSEPDLSTVPRNLVLFPNRKPKIQLSLIGKAADSIVDITSSSELAEVLTCERNGSTLHVSCKQKGGETDSQSPHISGEIVIKYQKILPDSIIHEQCVVRVLVVP